MRFTQKVKGTKRVLLISMPVFLCNLFATCSTFAITSNVGFEVNVDAAIALTIQSSSDNGTVYGTSSAQDVNNYSSSNFTPFGISEASVNIYPNSINDSMWSKVTVYTNNNRGYKLTVADADENTSLMSGLNMIPASDTVKAGISAWGFMGGKITRYAAMAPSSSSWTIAESSHKSAHDGDTTEVHYGVSTSGDQPSGVYSDTIVYTVIGEDLTTPPKTPNDSEFLNLGGTTNGRLTITNLGNNTYVMNGVKPSTASTSGDTVFIMLSEDIKMYEIQDSDKYKLLLYPREILNVGDEYKFSVDVLGGTFTGKTSRNNFRVNFRSLDKPDGGALELAYDFVEKKYYGEQVGTAKQRFSAVTVYIGRSQDITFDNFTFRINLEKL